MTKRISETTLRDVIRYKFDTRMAKGGVSIFAALLIVFLSLLVLMTLVRFFLGDEVAPLWTTFLELTDPGSMSADDGSPFKFKIFAVVAGMTGVVGLSVLIAFVTNSLNQRLLALRRGRSKVLEKGHTIIFGWSEQRVIEICRELIAANESESDACIVILSERAKEHMDDILRVHLPHTKSTRIVTRNGNIASQAMLDLVSVQTCRSVIVLPQCGDVASDETKAASDAKVIQTMLAVTSRRKGDLRFNLVSEIFDPAYRKIVQDTFDDNVVCVEADDVLARILVQTSRSVGLSVVYSEMLSFDGGEMYFFDADWGDVTFGDLAFRFYDGVPMGLRGDDGRIVLNPPVSRKLSKGDQVLILAGDDSKIEYSQSPVAKPRNLELVSGNIPQRPERELILGWTHHTEFLIEQYADYVEPGSEIDIMLQAPSEKIRDIVARVNQRLPNVTARLIEKNNLNREDLMSVEPFQYDNIIILAEEEGDATVRVDSENIVTLLLLQDIRANTQEMRAHIHENAATKLITEIVDSQNYDLFAEAGVNDVIISGRLISKMMAQISESLHLKEVYDQLFQSDGSEIYLKPARQYFAVLPDDVTFADMMRVAQKRGEVCLGWKIKALEKNTGEKCGVRLIPDKMKSCRLGPDDCLVVLAQDGT